MRTSARELLPWLPLSAVLLGTVVAPTPEADEIANQYRCARTQQFVCDLLAATAQAEAVIVLEDAHLMDGASAELVADVFSRVVPARSWLAVVTREDSHQELHTGGGYAALRLELPPLDPSATAQLAEKLAERMPVPVHLLPELVDRAAGNPLFLRTRRRPGRRRRRHAAIRRGHRCRPHRSAVARGSARGALRVRLGGSLLGDRFYAPLVDAVLRPLGVDSGRQDLWDRLHGFVIREEDGFAFGDLAAQGTVLHDLGSDAQRAGRVDGALWFYERSHEVRRRAGEVVGAASSANAIGEALLADGRLTEAAERFADALRAWRGARYPQGVSVALLNVGLVARRAGEAAEACRYLDEAYVLGTEIGGAAILADIRITLAEAFLDLGRFVEAWHVATEALAAGDDGKAGSAHRIRGQALLATGGTVRAGEELRAAAALAADAGERRTIERLLQDVARP